MDGAFVCPRIYFVGAEPLCRAFSDVSEGWAGAAGWSVGLKENTLAKLPFTPEIDGCHSSLLQEWSQVLGLLDTG